MWKDVCRPTVTWLLQLVHRKSFPRDPIEFRHLSRTCPRSSKRCWQLERSSWNTTGSREKLLCVGLLSPIQVWETFKSRISESIDRYVCSSVCLSFRQCIIRNITLHQSSLSEFRSSFIITSFRRSSFLGFNRLLASFGNGDVWARYFHRR